MVEAAPEVAAWGALVAWVGLAAWVAPGQVAEVAALLVGHHYIQHQQDMDTLAVVLL